MQSEVRKKELPEDMLKQMLFVRSVADHVMVQYEGYIYQFCVQRAWKRLKRHLMKAQSFNRIFRVHMEYLDVIMRFSFFGGIQNPNFRCVLKWMEAICELKGLVDCLTFNFDEDADHERIEADLKDVFGKLSTNGQVMKRHMKNTMDNASNLHLFEEAEQKTNV